MKLKVQHVMDATLVISQIIREQRPMPLKGKYRLSRMHAKLLPEFTTINEQRDAMITAYGFHPTTKDADSNEVVSQEFAVPSDKMAEFTEAWKKIADEEIEIDIEPIPLAQLALGDATDGCIEANELITLGDLVRE